MPIKKGHSSEVVSDNVRELVRSGYKPKQAVAMSLSKARKYKKMAAGGTVEEGYEEDETPRDLYESNADSQPPENETNPEEMSEMEKFAMALRKQSMEMPKPMAMAMGGLVEGQEEGELGTKPSEDMEDGLEEKGEDLMEGKAKAEHASMDPGTMSIIEERKKRRQYGAS